MGVQFAAFGLVFDSAGRILWKLRRDLEIWDLPGGCCEESDFFAGRNYDQSCLFREVKEETGLKIEVLSLVGLYFTEAVKHPIPSISAAYWCEIVDGTLVENDEAAEFGWFDPNTPPDNAFCLHGVMASDFPLWREKYAPLGLHIARDLRGMVDVHRRAQQ